MEIKITRKENIKPESPTPAHLRSYQLSLVDQLIDPVYYSLVYFYTSSDRTHRSDRITSNLSRLRESFSKILVHYYPFAGRLSSDGRSVDCNDEGAYYVEAQVLDHTLEQLLSRPEGRWVHQLSPFQDPSAPDNPILMVQATVFKCGGIALAIFCMHKVVDGSTFFCFKKAWATFARGLSDVTVPGFVAPSLFPQDPQLPPGSIEWPGTAFLKDLTECVTRRFVLDSQALSDLRARACSSEFGKRPSRFEVAVALIWRRATAVLRQIYGSKRHSVLSFPVDMRRRMVPRLPNEAFGNLFWEVPAVCNADDGAELPMLVRVIREAIVKIDNKYIEKLQVNFTEVYKELWEAYPVKEADATDFFPCNIAQNSVMYKLDFGWGEPEWVCPGERDEPWTRNLIFVMDTKSGDGIEAWVNMKEQDMAVLEKDAELLQFASVDPCPLKAGTKISFSRL